MALQPKIKLAKKIGSYFVVALGILSSANQAQAEISQSPLLVGGGNVPGSLALVPSVEYPTILTLANLGNYANTTEYQGYFDPNKCYTYTYVNNEVIGSANLSRFVPSGAAASRTCTGDNTWSGNHLNWAATQTIDPFRSALTGGYRVIDTANLTVIQKARNTGQGSYDTSRTINKTFTSVSPGSQTLRTRLNNGSTGYGFNMQFTLGDNWNNYCSTYNGDGSCKTTSNKSTVAYDGSTIELGKVYEAAVRVEVCKNSMLEANCAQYGSNAKPEGLIQQYANNLRYSVFGYLNDSTATRDGGVMRAAQKYVGPKLYDQTNNTNKEWSTTDGTFIKNPDNITTSMGVTIENSGVINYINKFGELTTNNDKSYDPVSELYYTAIRYFKGMSSVASYSSYPNTNNSAQWSDGFPVISDWTGKDPITYSCQKNIILGIGDTNSHKDKNLPSTEATSSASEPTKPTEVVNDESVDVVKATRKVGALEGVDLKVLAATFSGNNNNSAYIAGLAYDSHTKDLRSDLSGKQLLSTYWVDVREGGTLKPRATNQYWLAAKYGGFTVASDYGDPYTHTDTIPNALWTDGDLLDTGDARPRNFFVASDAARMVEGLKQAFAQIAEEVRGTTTSLATNSTQLDTGSAVFQSQFDSSNWSGDLLLKTVSGTGVVATTASWNAAAKLNAVADITNRKIFTANTLANSPDSTYLISNTGTNFKWANMDADTRTALKTTANNGTPVSDTVAQNRINFLRGDRTQERTSTTDTTHPFRMRGGRLGDIINSDPQYIGKQDYGYNLLRSSNWGTAGSAYLTYRASAAYQARTQMVVVGANDGMLHGFNADAATGGNELFAYVPRTVAANLYHLTDPDYAHRYYVDGTAASSDAWINDAWKSIVVGTTGAGGNAVFALDVTDPTNMTSNNVMWEFTAPDMGSTIEQSAIVALPNGKFGVVVSSGYSNSTVTSGQVWILDAADGSVIKKFTLPTSGYLGEPLAVDLNNDRMTDRLYVGDTQGNVWRIDVATTATSGWGVPSSLTSSGASIPLFKARDGAGNVQPITAPLSAALNTDGSPMVLFGSGSFYQSTDSDLSQNQRTESFYGIIDSGTPVNSNRSTLNAQKIIKQVTVGGTLKGRVLSNTTIAAASKGWYLDLLWKAADGGSNTLTGERVVSRASIRSGVVTFATLTPSSDPCTGGATSWIMSLDLFSGGRLTYNYFDINGDGSTNEADYYTDIDGTKIPYSGRSNPNEGAIKTPTFFNGTGTDGTGNTGNDLICFSSSKGEPQCSPVPAGTRTSNRISWRELR